MKKVKGIVFCLVFFVIVNFAIIEEVSSANAEKTPEKAYACLDKLLNEKTSISLQEAIFSVLALGNKKIAVDKIENEKSTIGCWPKSSCSIKDTSQVILAYNKINKNTNEAERWLLGRNGSVTGLSWFLEIDIQNHVPAECKITHGSSINIFNIDEDMKITGSGGSCLRIAQNGYWLSIADNCIGEEFSISCNKDFVTTVLYNKPGSSTIYVSSRTNSAPSLGTTTEKIEAQCMKIGNVCNYEGTLWAAVALHKVGREKDTERLMSYLNAFAQDNLQYFPSSLLYAMTRSNEHYSTIIQSQKQEKFWEIAGSPYNRFYDTALAMLGLQGTQAAELENAKNYLLNIQTKEGCWNNNNIRDTAFLLYSGWPIDLITPSSPGVVDRNGTITPGKPMCESAGYFCEARFACLGAGGTIYDGYQCSGGLLSCCSIKIVEQRCSEKRGVVCSSGQRCTGNEESSLDGSCCVGGVCEEVVNVNACETNNGVCRASCNDDEERSSTSCIPADNICCIKKTPISESETDYWIWILILSIFILLLIFGIIYRNKIRIWWFSFRGKAKISPVQRPRGPPIRPTSMPSASFGTTFGPRNSAQPPIRKDFSGDKEMEETMKKLKEMSG